MKNYIIIDKIELEERIKELRKVNNPAVNHIYSNMANELVNILSSGKDLQPILEDAFNEGFEDGIIASFGDNTDGDLMFRIKESEKQEYINNFKL